MKTTLTLICENTVGSASAALAEHGFSCLIERPDGAWLFDTGQGNVLGHNLEALGKDLAGLKAVFLSHGHYDHTGGLAEVLRRTGEIPVHAHPGIFQARYWVGKVDRRPIGIPFSREELTRLGARFCWQSEFTEVFPGLFFSGEIPRRTSFEQGDASLVIPVADGRGHVPDPFVDDCSLLLESDRGPILLLGCAHAGLANILYQVREKTGLDSIYALVGGTHLGPVDDDQFDRTVEVLEEFRVRKIMAGHCTGQKRAADLARIFGGRFQFAVVGTQLEA